MKKWINRLSYTLNFAAIVFLAVFFISKEEPAPPINPPSYTEQNLKRSSGVKFGMTFEEVVQVMGEPIKKEFSGKIEEEWHYCHTGNGVDEFVSIKFADGKADLLSHYVVTQEDTNGIYGDCRLFIKKGDYKLANPT